MVTWAIVVCIYLIVNALQSSELDEQHMSQKAEVSQCDDCRSLK